MKKLKYPEPDVTDDDDEILDRIWAEVYGGETQNEEKEAGQGQPPFVGNYNPSQPRDSQGRWGSGGSAKMSPDDGEEEWYVEGEVIANGEDRWE